LTAVMSGFTGRICISGIRKVVSWIWQ